MLYALLLYHDPAEPFDPDVLERHFAFWREAERRGAYVASEALGSGDTATTVRLRGSGDPLITDGPYAETKEQLGGFYILDCADLDEAIDYATQLPDRHGTTEIRPVMGVAGWDYGPTANRRRQPMAG